jgi:hypothetical protein
MLAATEDPVESATPPSRWCTAVPSSLLLFQVRGGAAPLLPCCSQQLLLVLLSLLWTLLNRVQQSASWCAGGWPFDVVG